MRSGEGEEKERNSSEEMDSIEELGTEEEIKKK